MFFAIPASRVSSLHLRLVTSENIAHCELYENIQLHYLEGLIQTSFLF